MPIVKRARKWAPWDGSIRLQVLCAFGTPVIKVMWQEYQNFGTKITFFTSISHMTNRTYSTLFHAEASPPGKTAN